MKGQEGREAGSHRAVEVIVRMGPVLEAAEKHCRVEQRGDMT